MIPERRILVLCGHSRDTYSVMKWEFLEPCQQTNINEIISSEHSAFDIMNFLSGSFQGSKRFFATISRNPTRILQDHGRLSGKSRRQNCNNSKIFHSVLNRLLEPLAHTLLLCSIRLDNCSSNCFKFQRGSNNCYWFSTKVEPVETLILFNWELQLSKRYSAFFEHINMN